MAVAENGKPVENVKDRPNGNINGHVNGHAVGPSSKRSTTATSRPRKSWSSWLFNNLSRLTIWYAILTIVIRCPSSPASLSETSPQICKPYLTAKTSLQPHLQPYYDIYAAPYVEIARPYADLVNRRVVRPASIVAQLNYDKYAAPQIETAKAYSQAQWERSIVPQLHTAQESATELYNTNVAPHIDEFGTLLGPHYALVKNNLLRVYQENILPSVEISQPYIQNAYYSSQHFMTTTAYPFARHAWTNVVIFIDGTFWPLVKGLYIDNVRPQLVMISERIAKYQESRKLKAAIDEVDTTTAPSSTTSTTSSPTTTPELDDVYAMFETDDDENLTVTESEQPHSTVQRPVRPPLETATEERISNDLVEWQKKFAAAADKGSEDLRERAEDIISSIVKSDLDGIGRGLANALEKTTVNEIENVKAKIRSVVGSISNEAGAEEVKQAAEDILGTIRASGVEIKTRAKKVREWQQSFEKALIQRLATAAGSTLEVLDGIKDLGLQEVGLRWAWMEGVTYKHWAKYHAVRQQLDDWRQEVSAVAMQNPRAEEAILSAQQILEESMAITEDAAKELSRLKSVAQWKLKARDATDDFETHVVPAGAQSAASSLVAELQGASTNVPDASSSIVSQVSDAAANVLPSASSLILGTTTSTLESAAASTQEALSSDSSIAALPSQKPTESFFSQATAALEDAYESASAYMAQDSGFEAPEPLVVQATDSASAQYEDIAQFVESATSVFAESASILTEGTHSLSNVMPSDASEAPGDIIDSASTGVESASTHSSSVFAGALAQDVKGQIPVLDDVFDESEGTSFSEKLQQVVNDAGDSYADVTRAVSEAIYGTQQGTIESFSSVASEQYANALAAASSALYGAPQGTAESISSAASDAYSQAVAAASSVIFGTPAPVTDSILQQASSIYSDAISRAEDQYSAAKSIASQQISGTPKPIHEQMFSSIESAYSGAQDNAFSRLDSARSAASAGYNSAATAASRALPTSNPLDSVAALASSVLQDSLSVASAQYSRAKEAVGITTAPAHQRYLDEARKNYYAAIGLAHEQYGDFVAAASTAVYGEPQPVLSSISSAASVAAYGTPKPAYQSLIDAAASQYSAASSTAATNMAALLDSASSAVGSEEKSPAQSVLDGISSQYSAAIAAASSSLLEASSSASSAIYGAPTGSIESVSSLASQNWESLVAQASERIYGTPKPFYEEYVTQAEEYSARATSLANDQYLVIQSFVSELIIGKEPDFTESAFSRLSSAYYTGYHRELASSASSYASDAYGSVSSIASSVSSVASSYFTPPPEVSSILDSVTEQLNSAVEAASAQVYGTTKGTFEQASSAAADSYLSASSAISEGIYGSQVGYAEGVQSSFANIGQSAQDAISLAIYGSSTGTVESVTSVVVDTYASISSVVADNVAAAGSAVGDISGEAASLVDTAKAKVSEAVYGPEQGALESAQSRIAEAVESARSAIAAMASNVGESGADAASAMSSSVEEAASAISSSVSSATSYLKDEL